MAQSSVFPIYLRAEYRDDGAGFARFQSDAQRAAQAAKKEFEGVRSALDAALSRPRNTGGSLDLGVDELRQAALAQQQVAAAAREVANATKAAATANGQFDASLSRSTRAAFELANAEERVSAELLQQVQALEAVQRELNQTASATDLVTDANRRGTTASRNVINSQRATRTAYLQLGQQLQDVAVQAQLGTSAFLIFGQQVPQAAFALSGLSDSANKTQRAIGNVATFLSGPWGAAIFIAVAALGPLVAKLFEGAEGSGKLSEALDKARFASDGMSSAQSILGNVIDLTTGKMKDQTDAANNLARAQLQLAEVRARVAANEARTTLQTATQRTTQVDIASVGTGSFGGSVFRSVRRPTVSAAAAKRALDGDVEGALDSLKEAVDTGKTTAAIYAETATAIANLGVESENIKRFGDALKALDGDQKALQQFTNPRRTSSSSGGGGAGSRRVDQAEQLAESGKQAAEQIQRINERFDEQPRLIDAAAQATRQLDDIIADLEQRKPLGFEKLIENAEAAKRTVEEAILRPIEQVREESEQRLKIQELLAAGQADRAVALQEILRLEQQIGDLNADQRAEIEDIVVAEQQRLRVLRDQQAVFNAQLDVLGTVRRDLTDILSGRSTDFFGNFKQALQDLQGARLFESIFGEAFREIENELQRNTPQGKANKALKDATDNASSELNRSAEAVTTFTDAITDATARIQGGALAANDNGGGSSIGGQAAIVQAALKLAGYSVGSEGLVRNINVNGKRKPETDISRGSIADIATRISREITESIVPGLEDIFGERFATIFGNIAGGIIAGKVTGGTTGAVLGGAKGLIDSFANEQGELSGALQGISDALGKAGEGAAIGTQIAGISKALGIKGSTTGSQILGAIGSLGASIPQVQAYLAATAVSNALGQGIAKLTGAKYSNTAGSLFGALPGFIVGALTPARRGSASIGGSGGSLGITGSRGNSSSRIETANTLAGSVLEAINQIASQLGVSVNASAGKVSVGQRDGNIRVDTTGQGITKTKNGAIDFGEDADAAIAFAVRDLIQDGVITGLRQSEQNLLRAGNDIEAALSDVLRFRDVFDQLDAIRDPVGGAIRRLNTEFESLIELFERAGATTEEFASLEELYDIRRAEAIQEATDRIVGSLRQLLNDLTIGDSGLSLRDRRSNALGEFNALAGRVAAGDTTAFDDFADISQQLLDIERQLFGSTQAYFDRLNQVTALTEQAIADQTNVTGIGGGAPSPFGDQITIDRSIDTMNSNLGNKLDAINDNLIAVLSPGMRPEFAQNEAQRIPRAFSVGNF